MNYYSFTKKSIIGDKFYSEILKCNSSVEYWRKVIKKDENDGAFVEAEFLYDKELKEIVLSSYVVISKKRNEKISIYLIKTLSTSKGLNTNREEIK